MEDMKNIEMHKRPNIGVAEMQDYVNGGLCIDSMERNGVQVYVPYGIWCDLFKAMHISTNVMHSKINELKQSIDEAEKEPLFDGIVANFKEQIKTLEEQIFIFDTIASLEEEI